MSVPFHPAPAGTPTPLKKQKRAMAIVVALFLLELLCVFFIVWRPAIDRTIEPGRIGHASGHSYVVGLSTFAPPGYRVHGDEASDPQRSDLVLFRDLSAIGRPHSLHVGIASEGQGAYSHWHDVLYFSTPGNTDPRNDGHRYSVKATLALSPLLAGGLFIVLVLVTFTLLAVLVKHPSLSGAQHSIGALFIAATSLAALFGGLRGRLLALLVVVAAGATVVTTNWREYYIAPDSRTYSGNQFIEPALRPPVVSIWLNAFSDRSLIERRMQEMVSLTGFNKSQIGSESDPILPAIQAQRLFLLIAFATLAFVATSRISPLGAIFGISAAVLSVSFVAAWEVAGALVALGVLSILMLMAHRSASITRRLPSLLTRLVALVIVAYLFSAQILKHSFLSEEQQYLLSEALAMSWQLLFAACALQFIWKPSGTSLIGAAVFAVLGYLTRSASVFLLVALGFLLVFALFHNRRFIGFALGAAVITVVMINAVPISWAVRGESSTSSAPMLNWGPIAFALEVAQHEDEVLLPDAESKRFFVEALRMRDDGSSRREAAPAYRSINLGANLYQVALPLAKQSVWQSTEDFDAGKSEYTWIPASSREVSELFGKVARPILAHRATEYRSIVGESALVATGLHSNARSTRLFESPWHWLALLSLVVLAFWGAEKDVKIAVAAALLIGMHIAHIAIVSVFDIPIIRYIHATEIFVVFAIVLLIDYQMRVVLNAGAENWFGVVRKDKVDDTNAPAVVTDKGTELGKH